MKPQYWESRANVRQRLLQDLFCLVNAWIGHGELSGINLQEADVVVPLPVINLLAITDTERCHGQPQITPTSAASG